MIGGLVEQKDVRIDDQALAKRVLRFCPPESCWNKASGSSPMLAMTNSTWRCVPALRAVQFFLQNIQLAHQFLGMLGVQAMTDMVIVLQQLPAFS